MRKLLYYLAILLIVIGCLNYAAKAFGNDILQKTLGGVANGNVLKGLYVLFALSALYISYDIIKNKEWFDLYLQATETE